jgi:hypothetical protein
MTLRDELWPFASNGREASALTDGWVTRIINTLQRDPRIDLNRFELELLLADHHSQIERQLFHLLVDRVHLDDIDTVDGVER